MNKNLPLVVSARSFLLIVEQLPENTFQCVVVRTFEMPGPGMQKGLSDVAVVLTFRDPIGEGRLVQFCSCVRFIDVLEVQAWGHTIGLREHLLVLLLRGEVKACVVLVERSWRRVGPPLVHGGQESERSLHEVPTDPNVFDVRVFLRVATAKTMK